MLDYDENEFIFTQPVWVVSATYRRDDPGQFIKGLLRIETARKDKTTHKHVAVFTDKDQADRLIEGLAKGGSERAAQLEPISFATRVDFEQFLKILMELGEERIALDPGTAHVRAIPITRFFE